MPLPQDWDGVFYSADTHGDLLFDLEAAELVDGLATRPDGPFLVAGAVFDLLWAKETDRATAILALAMDRWPNEPWQHLSSLYAGACNQLEIGRDKQVLAAAVSNIVTNTFTGGTLIPGQTES